jgi:hypothetical protein
VTRAPFVSALPGASPMNASPTSAASATLVRSRGFVPGLPADGPAPRTQRRKAIASRGDLAVAPGSAFGELGEGYVRLSLASSREDLLEGTSRLLQIVRLPKE